MDGPRSPRLRLQIITNLLVMLFAFTIPALLASPAFALRASSNYWKNPQDRIFLYWIKADGMCNPEQLANLRANLTQATRDWQGICPECGFKFVEVRNNEDATFPVVCVNVQKAFIADGFSRSDPKGKWSLKIDQSYFSPNSKFNRIGILRHEIGHILGYRHEQIAAPADDFTKCGWKTEKNTDDTSVITLTDYDPQSVMHYTCGAPAGPVLFEFSQKDIEGHRKLYGPAAVAPGLMATQTPPPRALEGADGCSCPTGAERSAVGAHP